MSGVSHIWMGENRYVSYFHSCIIKRVFGGPGGILRGPAEDPKGLERIFGGLHNAGEPEDRSWEEQEGSESRR